MLSSAFPPPRECASTWSNSWMRLLKVLPVSFSNLAIACRFALAETWRERRGSARRISTPTTSAEIYAASGVNPPFHKRRNAATAQADAISVPRIAWAIASLRRNKKANATIPAKMYSACIWSGVITLRSLADWRVRHSTSCLKEPRARWL